MTENICEVPTKIGLALTGLRLTSIAAVFVITFFILLRIFALPKFDYIVEKRLGDNYRTQFSEASSSLDGVPPIQEFSARAPSDRYGSGWTAYIPGHKRARNPRRYTRMIPFGRPMMKRPRIKLYPTMSGQSTASKQRGMSASGPWVLMGAYPWVA